jgi:peptidoglycan/xylan/chitin deacetylase (PgdA/CDA1 family)
MYHRVIPKDETESVQAGMYAEPVTFKNHIQFLKKHLRIIPISECIHNPGKKSEKTSNRPFCVLTFDDGWHDFYKYAFPILKKYNVPVTVFLPTDFIGTNRWFWTDRLTHLFCRKDRPDNSHKTNHVSFNPLVNELEKLKGSQESMIEGAIELLKTRQQNEIEGTLSELAERWNFEQEIPARAFLTWDEVREMKESGLITFGSHTASHRILTTLTDEEIRDELKRSKEKLLTEKISDPSCIPFCYPNGNYNEKTAELVKEMGYHLAVTTENGWNDAKADLFRLRRIGIHEDITSTKALFGCRITGII